MTYNIRFSAECIWKVDLYSYYKESIWSSYVLSKLFSYTHNFYFSSSVNVILIITLLKRFPLMCKNFIMTIKIRFVLIKRTHIDKPLMRNLKLLLLNIKRFYLTKKWKIKHTFQERYYERLYYLGSLLRFSHVLS